MHERSMLSGKWLGMLFLVCAMQACFAAPASAQAAPDPPGLRLQLLNGKTGRPVVNQRLMLLRKDGKPIDGVGKNGVTTDGEGYAPMPNVDAALVPEVVIAIDQHRPCSRVGKHSFSLVGVRATGVVSENSCKPRITMYPVAGTLIYFVRDETLFDRLRN